MRLLLVTGGWAAQRARAGLGGTRLQRSCLPHVPPGFGADARVPAPTPVQHVVPVVLSLLKDEIPDVRLSVISKLAKINQVIGIELLAQSLLPAIEELAEDKHWRVRMTIIEHIPSLALQLGPANFEDKLGKQCMGWLEDQVFSIRQARGLGAVGWVLCSSLGFLGARGAA